MSNFVDNIMDNIDILHEQVLTENLLLEQLVSEGILDSKVFNYIKGNVSKIKNIVKKQDIRGLLSIVKKVPKPSKDKVEVMASKLVPDYKSNLKNTKKIVEEEFGDVTNIEKYVMSRMLALVPGNKVYDILSKVHKRIRLTKGDVTKIIIRILLIGLLVITTFWYASIISVVGPNIISIVGILTLVAHILALVDILKEATERNVLN